MFGNQSCRSGLVANRVKYGKLQDSTSSTIRCHTGFSGPLGFQWVLGIKGECHAIAEMPSQMKAPNNTAKCSLPCEDRGNRDATQCEYRYPTRSSVWKKNMHVVHIAG